MDVPLLGRIGGDGHAGAGHELQAAAAPILSARASWAARCRGASSWVLAVADIEHELLRGPGAAGHPEIGIR